MSLHARNTDPGTSHTSAHITEETTLLSEVEIVAAAVRQAGSRGLTRGELEDGKYWRRFSDAEQKGLISPAVGQDGEPLTRFFAGTRRNQTVYIAPENGAGALAAVPREPDASPTCEQLGLL